MPMTTKSMRIAVFILAALLWVSAAQAAGFDLLRIDPTARGSALGGFPVAMTYGSAHALEVNPAGLAPLEVPFVSATYSDHPLDLTAGRINYTMPYKNGVASGSLVWFGYGSFDKRTDFDTPVEGTFGASDLLATVGYGRALFGPVTVGASTKILYSSIEEYSSTAVAFDLGALVHLTESRTDIGVTLANLGYQIDTYAGVREDLPLTLRIAGARKLEHLPLVLNATGHAELGGDLYLTGGGEFTVSDLLVVRAGYTTLSQDLKVSGSEDAIAGFSAGIGLSHESFRLDYAFQSQGAIGTVHRISAGILLP